MHVRCSPNSNVDQNPQRIFHTDNFPRGVRTLNDSADGGTSARVPPKLVFLHPSGAIITEEAGPLRRSEHPRKKGSYDCYRANIQGVRVSGPNFISQIPRMKKGVHLVRASQIRAPPPPTTCPLRLCGRGRRPGAGPGPDPTRPQRRQASCGSPGLPPRPRRTPRRRRG